MYHRVIRSINEESCFVQPGMYVLVDSFRAHIEYLKKKFNILPMPQLIQRIDSGQSTEGFCAITFDDGWRDNFSQAFPLLLEYKIPATIFLATGYIGTNKYFWPEELTFYFKQFGSLSSLPKSPLMDRITKVVNEKEQLNDGFYNRAIMELKNWTPEDRRTLLSQLHSQCSAPPPERQLISWEEAKKMQDSRLITFGSHTANHLILDQVPLYQAEKEILQSRYDIEKNLGVTPELFAYPNGNFTSELKRLLKKNGFKGAVTTQKGWVNKDNDLFEIPRIGIHQDISSTIPLFQARMLLKWF